MGAIIGILRLDGRAVCADDLRAMAARSPQRFSSSLELWTEGPVGLGRCGAAAMAARGRGVGSKALLFEGHAHECSWMQGKLRGQRFAASALDAYERSGRSAFESIIGDFAFALWDGSRGRLVLGRDAVGVRPLYRAAGPSVVAFSTDLRCLLAVDGISTEIDETGILHLFYPELLFVDRTSTSYAAIKRVPAATHQVYSLASAQRSIEYRYWSLDPEREVRLNGDEEYASALLSTFREAVACRIPDEGAVGTTLSGGLDSASVTCLARAELEGSARGPLHTFSAEFPSFPDVDESGYQHAVVAMGGIEAHQLRPDQSSPLVDFEDVVKIAAEPFYGPNYYLPWGICKSARTAGVEVVLDGTDGDITVGHGIDQLVGLAEQARWQDFVAAAEAIVDRYAHPTYATKNGILEAHGLPALERQARRGRLLAFFSGVQTLGLGFNRSRLGMVVDQGLGAFRRRSLKERGGELNPEFAEISELEERFSEYERARSFEPGPRASHHRDLSSGALSSVLEHLDRFAAAWSVEMRHPFADRRLIELCLALPPAQKLRDGWGRWVLRQGMKGRLPETIRWRGDKAAISPVFLNGLRVYEERRLRELLASRRLGDYLDRSRLEVAVSSFLGGPQAARQGPLLWRAVMLDTWLRTRESRPARGQASVDREPP